MRARDFRRHAFVADVGVAGADGQLVRRFHGLDGTATIPVVAVVSGREHSAEGMTRVGFSACLRKPIDPWALCRLLAGLAGKA